MRVVGISFLALIGLSCVVAAIFGIGYIIVHNQEASLRNRASAQWKILEANHDKIWKIISQKSQIAESHKDSFNNLYPELMKARYEQMTKLLSGFVAKTNPQFDSSMFQSLAQSVDAERTSFFNEQRQLQNIVAEYNYLREGFFGSVFLARREKMEYPLIYAEKK